MLNTRYRQRGFTLIELMVGVIIIAILLGAGIPSLKSWVQNSKIRTTADVIQNGLQLARAEAVSRNSPVRFQLTTTIDNTCALSAINTSITSNWVVSLDDPTILCGKPKLNEAFPLDDVTNNPPPRIIQTRSSAEGSRNTVVAADQSTIIFNGLGRSNGATVNINLTNPAGGACAPAGTMRCLRVEVTPGGQIRMCDPSKASTDPQGC